MVPLDGGHRPTGRIGLGDPTGEEPQGDVERTDRRWAGRDGLLVEKGGHGRGHLGRTLGNLDPGDLGPRASGATVEPMVGLVDGGKGERAHRGIPTVAWASMASAARRYSLANQSPPRWR